MKRTNIHFSEERKHRLEELTVREPQAEASIVREALETTLDAREGSPPTLPLFDGWGELTLADRVDEILNET